MHESGIHLLISPRAREWINKSQTIHRKPLYWLTSLEFKWTDLFYDIITGCAFFYRYSSHKIEIGHLTFSVSFSPCTIQPHCKGPVNTAGSRRKGWAFSSVSPFCIKGTNAWNDSRAVVVPLVCWQRRSSRGRIDVWKQELNGGTGRCRCCATCHTSNF